MSTTVKIENVYCVYDPDGIPILRTVENEPDDSISRLTTEDTWKYWYLGEGYIQFIDGTFCVIGERENDLYGLSWAIEKCDGIVGDNIHDNPDLLK